MKRAPSVSADVSLVLVTITLFLSVLTKDLGILAVCFTLFIYSNMPPRLSGQTQVYIWWYFLCIQVTFGN